MWEPFEYTMDKHGFFVDCVKKIQSTDNPNLFVSALKLTSLSAQDASTTGGGNASIAIEDVSPSNDPQSDGSVTLASEVVERNCLQLNEQQPLTVGHSAVKFSEGIHQVSMTLGIDLKLLRETITGVSRGDVNIHQDFARCGPPMIKSAHAVEVVGRTVVSQSVIEFSSNAISQVIKPSAVDVSMKLFVSHVSLSVIITVPAQLVGEIINFCRANGPDVLRTISRCFEQIGGLLQLDNDPSKTALILCDAVSDNTHKFLLWMFQKMKQIISLLEQQSLSEDATGWEIVESVEQSVEVVSSNRSASSALELVSNKSPEHLHSGPSFDTGIDVVNVVNSFSDHKYIYKVHRDRISFPIGPDLFNVDFGIPLCSIQNIVVYGMTTSVFLIVIRTFDHQVYLSGHSATSTSPIFVKTQITTHLSVGQPNEFKSIEFDANNNLRFQINMSNWKKIFSIDERDGSIQQRECLWKN